MSSQFDPIDPRYYFSGDSTLPFDILSLASTLPEMLNIALEELTRVLEGKLTAGGQVTGPMIDISGPVYIGAGTHIHPGVSIVGPVYIGRNCSNSPRGTTEGRYNSRRWVRRWTQRRGQSLHLHGRDKNAKRSVHRGLHSRPRSTRRFRVHPGEPQV